MRVIALTLLSISFYSCERVLNLDFVGDGNLQVQDRSAGLFNAATPITEIILESDFILEVSSSEIPRLQVEADANLQPYIIAEVDGGALTLRAAANINLISHNPLKIIISMPALEEIVVNAPGIIHLNAIVKPALTVTVTERAAVSGSNLQIGRFWFRHESSGRAKLQGNFDALWAHQIGSGEINFEGVATQSYLVQEGSGIIDASNLNTVSSIVRLFGTGLVFCMATTTLDARVSGAGRVYVTGSPVVSYTIDGGGAVVSR